MKQILSILAAGAFIAQPESTIAKPPETIELTSIPPVLKQDRAYLLIRIRWAENGPPYEPIFLRVPTSAELDTYLAAKQTAFERAKPKLEARRAKILIRKAEADTNGASFKEEVPPEPTMATFDFPYEGPKNVQVIDHRRALVEADRDNLLLVEATPGEYILYGASFGVGARGLHTCWCLGTVGFSANAGEVTNLGSFVADQAWPVSTIPQLTAETGLGRLAASLITATIIPPIDDGSSSGLNAAKIVKATFHAEGKFVTLNTGTINRLAPIPGVLAYNREQVIDVQSGKAVEDRY